MQSLCAFADGDCQEHAESNNLCQFHSNVCKDDFSYKNSATRQFYVTGHSDFMEDKPIISLFAKFVSFFKCSNNIPKSDNSTFSKMNFSGWNGEYGSTVTSSTRPSVDSLISDEDEQSV